MVRARLHVICGNCGCNDEFEWQHIPLEVIDGNVVQDEDVVIECRNCVTLHYLSDNAKAHKGGEE